MFKKLKKKGKTIKAEEDHDKPKDEEPTRISLLDIASLRQKIQNQKRKPLGGIQIKQIKTMVPQKSEYDSKGEEKNEIKIKKVFIPEAKIKERTNDFLGIKREKEERIKEQGRIGLIQMQKEIYSLPENLKTNSATQDDYVENLLKLSSAGIIDVPVSLEEKIKSESTSSKTKIDLNLIDNLFLLKDDIKSSNSNNSAKTLTENFGNVFLNQQGRKMKFIREKEKNENKKVEGM